MKIVSTIARIIVDFFKKNDAIAALVSPQDSGLENFYTNALKRYSKRLGLVYKIDSSDIYLAKKLSDIEIAVKRFDEYA